MIKISLLLLLSVPGACSNAVEYLQPDGVVRHYRFMKPNVRDTKVKQALIRGAKRRYHVNGQSLCQLGSTPVPCPKSSLVWQDIDVAIANDGLDMQPYGNARRLIIPIEELIPSPKGTPRFSIHAASLDDVAALMRTHPLLYADVIAHGNADDTPHSQRWAGQVAAILHKQGVEMERLFLQHAGADEPIGSPSTNAGRARNRRVELRLYVAE